MEGRKLTPKDFSIKGNNVRINGNGNPGMILIWADWCGHCQRFKPTFNKMCKKLGDDFPCVSIDDTELSKDKNLAKSLNFRGFPTIKFFDQTGKIIADYASERSEAPLYDHICEFYHHCVSYH
jgi:thiol-disulfide isomerase/thioredoxin